MAGFTKQYCKRGIFPTYSQPVPSVLLLYLYSMQSAAPRTALPRAENRTLDGGGLEAGTLITRPPHLLLMSFENALQRDTCVHYMYNSHLTVGRYSMAPRCPFSSGPVRWSL